MRLRDASQQKHIAAISDFTIIIRKAMPNPENRLKYFLTASYLMLASESAHIIELAKASEEIRIDMQLAQR